MATQRDADMLNALLADDTELQALLAGPQGPRGQRGGMEGPTQRAIRGRMTHIGADPKEFSMDLRRGTVDDKGFLRKHGGKLAMGAAGALVGAPFLGALGGGAAAAGGGAAGGGGISLSSLLGGLTSGAQVAGKMAESRAAGRMAEAGANNDRDRLSLERSRMEQDANDRGIGLDLDQRRYADESNDRARRNAIMSSLLAGMEDTAIAVPENMKRFLPTITGGAKPSAIQGREEIARLGREEAMKQMANPLRPGGIPGQPNGPSGMPSIRSAAVPALSAMPSPSWLDKLLSGVGMAGSIAGSLYTPRSRTTHSAPSSLVNPRKIMSGVRFQ